MLSLKGLTGRFANLADGKQNLPRATSIPKRPMRRSKAYSTCCALRSFSASTAA
ncbi:hypothetical protein SuNHUV7_32180 (plasmid) [Pseudoseohaeicola sp. NH-UV-7]